MISGGSICSIEEWLPRHIHRKGELVATFRIYLDESEGDAAYVASGWACRTERWNEISEAWDAVRRSPPEIEYFKLNEAMGLKGQFEGWLEADRDRKVKALAKTLPHEAGFFGHGCYVSRTDFEAAKAGARRIYRFPYFFCVAVAMVYAVAGENQIVGTDKIDFVLDRSREAIQMRKLFYSDIKPRFPRLGECIDLDDKEIPPLQAADLNAGLLRQMYEPMPRLMPGREELNGIFEAAFELKPKGLQDIISTSLFRKKSSLNSQ